MKDNGILSYDACIFCILAICTCLGFAAPQITVERGAPPRNLTPAQNQQNLPPEKKKSLSKFGPEDVFPGMADQEEKRRQSTRGGRRGSPAAKPSATPGSSPSPTPSLTPEPTQPTTPTPAPTTAALPTTAAPISGAAQPNSSVPSVKSNLQSTIPQWLLPSLAILSLIVLCILIYVVIKLYEQLRPGRPPYSD